MRLVWLAFPLQNEGSGIQRCTSLLDEGVLDQLTNALDVISACEWKQIRNHKALERGYFVVVIPLLPRVILEQTSSRQHLNGRVGLLLFWLFFHAEKAIFVFQAVFMNFLIGRFKPDGKVFSLLRSISNCNRHSCSFDAINIVLESSHITVTQTAFGTLNNKLQMKRY